MSAVTDRVHSYRWIGAIHDGTEHRIKDREKAELFLHLLMHPGTSRQKIARALQLRPTTVSHLVKELIADGLAEEHDQVNGGGRGRPERVIAPRPQRLLAAGVTTVSRHLHARLVTLTQEPVRRVTSALPQSATTEEIARTLRRVGRRLLTAGPGDKGARLGEVVGMGYALPGIIDPDSGRWIASVRWPALAGLDLRKLQRSPYDTCHIRREQGMVLEHLLRADPGLAHGATILVHWGFGIGAAVSHGGTVLSEATVGFGEIGHWRLDPRADDPCVCGRRGCLETRASLWALGGVLARRVPGYVDDEVRVVRRLASADLLRIPAVQAAADLMVTAMENVALFHAAEHVLVIGPFTANHALFEYVRRRTLDRLSMRGSRPPVIRSIRPSPAAPIESVTIALLRQALRPYLRARW